MIRGLDLKASDECGAARTPRGTYMTNGNGHNSFSWGDALFLHIERPGQPLNIAGVSVFEGEIKLRTCAPLSHRSFR